MQQVIIIGNAGAAIECHTLFFECCYTSPMLRFAYTFKGFLAYEKYPERLGSLAHLQIGSTESYEIQANDIFAIGIAEPELRAKVYLSMKSKGAKFMNLISPWAYIGAAVTLGEANIIQIGTQIAPVVKIGNANYFNAGSKIGHDTIIGDYNFFGPDTGVMGNVQIGSRNKIATRVCILEKVKIGDDNNIAPMSCVYKGCKDNKMLMGNPALHVGDI